MTQERDGMNAVDGPVPTGPADDEHDDHDDHDANVEGTVRSASPMTDDRLRLIFTCCHPALSMEARVALTLKVVANLPTATIGRMFLTSEATVGQRLLRAKQRIAHAGIPYRVPFCEALAERVDGVLAVIYLIFTQGYADADATDSEEAIRLGRLVVELLPESDEAHGLLALMLLQHARRDARTVDGELVTLEAQDRSRWDDGAIAEGLALLHERSTDCGTTDCRPNWLRNTTAADAATTDRVAIVGLYDELLRWQPSPVVALNRAVAVGMSDGPLAGLAELDRVGADPRLDAYHLLPAARADLLARAGRAIDACEAFDRAIELTPTDAERRQLARRRDELP